jgi:hypothetical protein
VWLHALIAAIAAVFGWGALGAGSDTTGDVRTA